MIYIYPEITANFVDVFYIGWHIKLYLYLINYLIDSNYLTELNNKRSRENM